MCAPSAAIRLDRIKPVLLERRDGILLIALDAPMRATRSILHSLSLARWPARSTSSTTMTPSRLVWAASRRPARIVSVAAAHRFSTVDETL